MPKPVQIAGRTLGAGQPPLIVAELSGNHHGSLAQALALVERAAAAGADAIKLQTFIPERLTLDSERPEFRIDNPASLWHGRKLIDLYRETQTPLDWHPPLFQRCRELGLIGFSSPFDPESVEFLDRLEVPCFKIASFEAQDLPLVQKAAATGKPLIVSTGMARVSDIEATVRAARSAGCRDLILLKCTSAYPAPPDQANLATLPHLAELFDCPVGLSDHSLGLGVALAATALGACLIEKHFTLARAGGGPDAAFSLEPPELDLLVSEARRAWQALGRVQYGPVASEIGVKRRRSLYALRDIAQGELFTHDNLGSVRPGLGLAPRHLPDLLGRRASRDIPFATPLDWSLVSPR